MASCRGSRILRSALTDDHRGLKNRQATYWEKTLKPTIFAAALVAATVPAVAGSNFNSGTGVLVIPDVTVDGQSFYDSVTLKLDMSTRTFSVISATPKNPKLSDVPLQVFDSDGVTVGFNGCYRSGTNQVTCQATVTNLNNDADMAFAAAFYSGSLSSFSSIKTTLYDNFGAPYTGSVTALNKTDASSVSGMVLQGVPVRVTYVFTNVDSRATSIAAFSPAFAYAPTRKGFVATFKNISF